MRRPACRRFAHVARPAVGRTTRRHPVAAHCALVTRSDIVASHACHGSNVREIFFDLYDRHERAHAGRANIRRLRNVTIKRGRTSAHAVAAGRSNRLAAGAASLVQGCCRFATGLESTLVSSISRRAMAPGALDLTEFPCRVWALDQQSPLGHPFIAVFRSWHCFTNWQTLPSENSHPIGQFRLTACCVRPLGRLNQR